MQRVTDITELSQDKINDLTKLPQDMIDEISLNLKYKDLIQLSETCSSLYRQVHFTPAGQYARIARNLEPSLLGKSIATSYLYCKNKPQYSLPILMSACSAILASVAVDYAVNIPYKSENYKFVYAGILDAGFTSLIGSYIASCNSDNRLITQIAYGALSGTMIGVTETNFSRRVNRDCSFTQYPCFVQHPLYNLAVSLAALGVSCSPKNKRFVPIFSTVATVGTVYIAATYGHGFGDTAFGLIAGATTGAIASGAIFPVTTPLIHNYIIDGTIVAGLSAGVGMVFAGALGFPYSSVLSANFCISLGTLAGFAVGTMGYGKVTNVNPDTIVTATIDAIKACGSAICSVSSAIAAASVTFNACLSMDNVTKAAVVSTTVFGIFATSKLTANLAATREKINGMRDHLTKPFLRR
jgi:hypothetical protein